MAIKIGIQEDIKFTGFNKDDKGNLEILVAQGEEVDTLAAMMSGGDLGGQESGKIVVWALNNTAYGKVVTGKPLIEHINAYKAFLQEIVNQLVPTVKVDWSDMFKGLSVAKVEDVESFDAEQVAKVGENLIDKFLELVKDAVPTEGFRVKFIRSTPAKAFISLKPDMFTKFNRDPQPSGFRKSWTIPFIESMAIPKSQSKLAYTKQEIEKGHNNPDPVKADAEANNDLPF